MSVRPFASEAILTPREQKLAEHLDNVLRALERESLREVAVKEDATATWIESRSVGWFRWIVAGPFLLLAFWMTLAAAISLFEHGNGVLLDWRAAIPTILIAASVAVAGLIIVSVRERIVISQSDLCIWTEFARVRVKRCVPLSTIRDIRIGAFTFASWDRYVVVVTEDRRYRFAWGISEASAREIAQAVLRALPAAD